MQLVIPARNEAGRLPRTLSVLKAHVLATGAAPGSLEVLVVDNASTDETARLALEASTPLLPVRVVECHRRGKGAAVREGIRHTTADIVGYMDADGATDLSALREALRLMAAGADVAVASRALASSLTTVRHSRVRAWGATLYRRCTQRVAPGIADTQCGFKVIRGPLARRLFTEVHCDGFSFDVELLARAQRAGARVVEFPARWVDVPGSTFLPFFHGAATFVELYRIDRDLRRGDAGVVTELPVARQLPLDRGESATAALPAVADG